MNNKAKKQLPLIVVNQGTRGFLARDFKTTYFTVSRALEGLRVSPLHLAIRAKARELGGIVIE